MTPQEIKGELIKMNWEDNQSYLYKSIDKDVNLYYNDYGNIIIELAYDSFVVELPTLERIKGLVFGLTGEEM
jgi:hypothetical protein